MLRQSREAMDGTQHGGNSTAASADATAAAALVSGMHGDLVELLDAAETDGVKGVEESQEHDKFC